MNRLVLGLLSCFASSVAFAQTDPAAIVLTVNGDTVKAADYYRKMEYLPGTSKKMGAATLNYPPGFLTLEAIIHERLVFQLAKQKGVMPSDAEIQAELNAELTENPKLLNDAAIAGQTRGDVEYQLKYQLAMFKLTTFGITLTDQEIDKFYRDNPTMFTIPKRAELLVIAVTDEATKSKVDSELAAGKPFGEVAKTYSEDVTKADGGKFGIVPIAGLPEGVRDAVTKAKIGQTTNWVPMANSSAQAKFLLVDIKAEERTPLDAKLRKRLRRQLMIQRGQVKNDIEREMAQLRSKSKIDFANKTFAEMYKKYADEYLRQLGQFQGPPPPL